MWDRLITFAKEIYSLLNPIKQVSYVFVIFHCNAFYYHLLDFQSNHRDDKMCVLPHRANILLVR